MGQTFPILLRGIDLSVGAMVALVGMVVFDLLLILHVPGYIVLPIALVAGVSSPVSINGALVVFLRLQPFIATLATLAAYRGLVYAISGRQLVPGLSTTPIPDRWILLGIETYVDVGLVGPSKLMAMPGFRFPSSSCWGCWCCFTSCCTTPLRARPLRDRRQYRGSAPGWHRHRPGDPYRLCDLRLLRGRRGPHLLVRFTTATEALGAGMELTAIAAAVIGGVSLAGGVGSVLGPVIGAFLLGVVLLGLTLLGISHFVQPILTGAILLAAVGYDRLMVCAAAQGRCDSGGASRRDRRCL